MISTAGWWRTTVGTILGGAAGLLLVVPAGLLLGILVSSEGIEALPYGYVGAIVGPLIGAIWAAYSTPSPRGDSGRKPAAATSAAFALGLTVGAWTEYSNAAPLFAGDSFLLAFAWPWATGATLVFLAAVLRQALTYLAAPDDSDGGRRMP